MKQNDETKNIMETGGLPTGTYNKKVFSIDEDFDVDPKVIANAREVLAGGRYVHNYDTNSKEFKKL